MDKKDFLLYVEQYNPNMDTESIGLAFDFGKEVFQEQYRKSGEPYFIHCIETAKTLVKLRLDKATIIAGLLHDVVEDTPVKLEEIREKFGDEIAFLVDGLTKITDVQRKDITYQQAETFRKMLIAMAKDIRVILVKLADRLHNMRTLEYHSDKDKIRRIAQETLDIYVPIAYRLGMASIKTELEDLCLKFLKPEIYEDIVRKLNQTRNEQNATLEEMKSELNNLLKSFNIKYRLLSRVKHYSSIYRKMTKRGIPLEEMRDLLGTKIITSSIAECYQIIGIVHQHWHTIPDEFYDYIANPKSNNYQSIHTAIRYKNNYPVKLHIETEEMHIRAEAGIAAHWKYESSDFKDKALESYLIWLRRLLEWLPESENSEEFMSNLKLDLYPEEIYVFTPIGEIKQLPLDATPVDFAFAVHTEVGLHCEAAKVDGKKVPLDTTLQSGQTVEIISSKLKTPSTEWLRFVKTGKARSAIHRYQKESNSRLCRIIGEELLYREIRRQKIKIKNLEDELKNITQKLDYTNISDLFIAIGNGYLPLKAIIEHLPETKIGLSLLPLKENLLSLIRKSSKGLSLQQFDNVSKHFEKCCSPVYGDKIIGIYKPSKGIIIHRVNCPEIQYHLTDPDQTIDLEWGKKPENYYNVQITILAQARIGLLGDIGGVIARTKTCIKSAQMNVKNDWFEANFVLEIRDSQHLKNIEKKITKIKEVRSVTRSRVMY